jgi:hypothetical protein
MVGAITVDATAWELTLLLRTSFPERTSDRTTEVMRRMGWESFAPNTAASETHARQKQMRIFLFYSLLL